MRLITLFSLILSAVIATTSPVRAADKLTVLLDWFVNPDHAPLVIAETRGFFKEQGLEVTIVPPSDPSAPPRLVAAGQGDIAISYQPQLHVQVAEGLPLTRIGTIAETPLNALVALKHGPIKKISDLKGKKVGFSVGGFEDALLSAMLKKPSVDSMFVVVKPSPSSLVAITQPRSINGSPIVLISQSMSAASSPLSLLVIVLAMWASP